MELDFLNFKFKIGDLVKHNVHGFYGIVLTNTTLWGPTEVCKVEWCKSGKRQIIDISFLDKVSK